MSKTNGKDNNTATDANKNMKSEIASARFDKLYMFVGGSVKLAFSFLKRVTRHARSSPLVILRYLDTVPVTS